jgi:hypothetical protein
LDSGPDSRFAYAEQLSRRIRASVLKIAQHQDIALSGRQLREFLFDQRLDFPALQ